MSRLDGSTALVVGAGRGLGKAIADGLSQRGARVIGTSRSKEQAELIASRYGTFAVVLDFEDQQSLHAKVDEVFERSGGIDLLCNNAGINIPEPAVEVSLEHWNRVMNTNVTGPFLVSQQVARHWIAAGTAGSIVNVSSQAGTVAIEDRAGYGASKAALSHLTRILALEWGPHGIRVNAVAPTFVATELTASTLADPGRAEAILARIPLGRWGQPEDVAHAVAYLLSSDASMVTGHILAVYGGYTIH